jgi:signal transduction histidine kinase
MSSTLKRTESGLPGSHENSLQADLIGRLIDIQEEERDRIARELHDSLSQTMALISVDIEQLTHLRSRSMPAVREGLRKVLDRVRSISTEIRRMSDELHPSKLDRLGLTAAIRGFCREISIQGKLHAQFESKSVPDPLPREVALCLYRVAQEALQNTIMHSGASNATVTLQGSPFEIRLSIKDEGIGFAPGLSARKQGLGLISMRERLRLVGGTLSVESRPSQGTRISAVIPLKTTDAQPVRNLKRPAKKA